MLFNCGEEHNENYRLSQALDNMRALQSIDPLDHPRGIHNVNQPHNEYIDAECVDFTSIQTGSPGTRRGLANALEHNRITTDWIQRCVRRQRRILVVNFDEARPEEDRGQAYAIYLPVGGRVSVDWPVGGTYEVAWWDPANGIDGRFQNQRVVKGGPLTLEAPNNSDWAVRIVRRSAE